MRDPAAFIAEHTNLMFPPLVPEIRLHLAEESVPIWQKSEDELGEINVAPPFWAFAWAGGQALARYILDNRALFVGQRVLDLGTGSGLTAIAAKLAGAGHVVANDVDELALASVGLNAKANGVEIEISGEDLLMGAELGSSAGFDVILVGDLFYERQLADRVVALLDLAARGGALVLVGDPQRSYFPTGKFTQAAEYEVAVTRELEDALIKRTAVWRL
jgi:predicted nicotinamide N-methyase